MAEAEAAHATALAAVQQQLAGSQAARVEEAAAAARARHTHGELLQQGVRAALLPALLPATGGQAGAGRDMLMFQRHVGHVG